MQQYIRAYAFAPTAYVPLDLVRISSHQPVTPSHCCPVIVVCNSATETNLIVLTAQTDTWPGKPVCTTPVEKPSKERCHKSLSLPWTASYHEEQENRSHTPVHSACDDGHCPAGYRAMPGGFCSGRTMEVNVNVRKPRSASELLWYFGSLFLAPSAISSHRRAPIGATAVATVRLAPAVLGPFGGFGRQAGKSPASASCGSA